jgi:hypothetical protein
MPACTFTGRQPQTISSCNYEHLVPATHTFTHPRLIPSPIGLLFVFWRQITPLLPSFDSGSLSCQRHLLQQAASLKYRLWMCLCMFNRYQAHAAWIFVLPPPRHGQIVHFYFIALSDLLLIYDVLLCILTILYIDFRLCSPRWLALPFSTTESIMMCHSLYYI